VTTTTQQQQHSVGVMAEETALIPLNVGPSLLAQQHVSAVVNGSDTLVVIGGYQLIDRYIHRDINDEPDRIFLDRVEFNNQVYLFDIASASWSRVAFTTDASERPIGRILHSLSVSADGESIVLFGGSHCFRDFSDFLLAGEALGDIWKLHLSNLTWTAMHRTATVPRCNAAFAAFGANVLSLGVLLLLVLLSTAATTSLL
jgi:hypothetical protein